MEVKHDIKPAKKPTRTFNASMVWHFVIFVFGIWMIVSQILAVYALRFLVENYRFVPKADVVKAEVVLSPIAQ